MRALGMLAGVAVLGLVVAGCSGDSTAEVPAEATPEDEAAPTDAPEPGRAERSPQETARPAGVADPAEVADPAPAPALGVTATAALDVRAGPALDWPVRGALAPGDVFSVEARLQAPDGPVGWLRIVAEDVEGWIQEETNGWCKVWPGGDRNPVPTARSSIRAPRDARQHGHVPGEDRRKTPSP